MDYVTPTALARIAGVAKQAVFKAIDAGTIPYTLQGKKKLIDINEQSVQLYIKDDNRQREAVKKNETASELPVKKHKKSKTAAKLSNKKAVINKGMAELLNKLSPIPKEESKIDDLVKQITGGISAFEINVRTKKAAMEKKEYELQILQKKFLPTDFIENGLFRYIEKLNSNIERIASVSVTEIGNKILEAGEILPAHIEAFTNQILTAIHETKKSIMKEIEKYDPNNN